MSGMVLQNTPVRQWSPSGLDGRRTLSRYPLSTSCFSFTQYFAKRFRYRLGTAIQNLLDSEVAAASVVDRYQAVAREIHCITLHVTKF